jgi:hypothetical protein
LLEWHWNSISPCVKCTKWKLCNHNWGNSICTLQVTFWCAWVCNNLSRQPGGGIAAREPGRVSSTASRREPAASSQQTKQTPAIIAVAARTADVFYSNQDLAAASWPRKTAHCTYTRNCKIMLPVRWPKSLHSVSVLLLFVAQELSAAHWCSTREFVKLRCHKYKFLLCGAFKCVLVAKSLLFSNDLQLLMWFFC